MTLSPEHGIQTVVIEFHDETVKIANKSLHLYEYYANMKGILETECPTNSICKPSERLHFISE